MEYFAKETRQSMNGHAKILAASQKTYPAISQIETGWNLSSLKLFFSFLLHNFVLLNFF